MGIQSAFSLPHKLIQPERKTLCVPGRSPVKITKSGSVRSRRMPADAFTGTVWQDPIIDAPAPALIRAPA